VVVTVGPSGAGGAQFTITEADLTTAGGNTDEVLAQVIKDNIDSLGIDGLTTTVGGSGTAELTIDSTSTQAIDIDIAVNGTAAGANAGTTTVAGATGATASGTTATFDVATADGSVTAGDVTLTLGGETFTATNVAAAAGGVAAEIVSQYEASSSQIDGIELSVDGSDNLVVTNLNTDRSFDGLAIDTSALGTAGNDDVNAVSLGNATARGIDITIGAGEIAEGDSFAVTIGDDTATYVAGANDDVNDVVRGLQAVIAADGPSDVSTTLTLSTNTETTGAAITINSDVGKTVSVAEARGGTATGDLYALGQIDVRTADGAAKALNSIESLIQTNIDASAEFGASERRIEIQSDFMGSLIDSFKSGIGSLVDADLEEASARLQALQVQQQLGVQALSIANQAPQNILALFR
jgi:flagellin